MIKQTYEFAVPSSRVWQALVDPELIKQWSGSDAKMSADEEQDFSLWGGDIWGTNTKVVPEQLLEQDWYGDKWDEPSKVVIKLNDSNGVTLLTLEHSGVPDDEESSFDDGWRDYYFGPMKDLLENER